GSEQHRFGQVSRVVTRGVRRESSRFDGESLGWLCHLMTDERMGSCTVNAHPERFEACTKYEFSHGGAADVSCADNEDGKRFLRVLCGLLAPFATAHASGRCPRRVRGHALTLGRFWSSGSQRSHVAT